MSTNSNFTIAVHILTMLAFMDDPVPSSLMAQSINTNPVTIRRMVGILREAGLVRTVPGSTGGALLDKPTNAITLADVYQITKEDTVFGLHPNTPSVECLVGRNIERVLRQYFEETDRLITTNLAQVTIQDVLDNVQIADRNCLE